MKSILAFAFATGLLLAGTGAASAMMAPPAPHSQASGLIHVRDGCGRGFHENRHGRCERNDDGWAGGFWRDGEWRDRGWHDGDDRGWHDGDRHGDGCDRWHHRNRWGRCVRNF